MSGSSPRSAKSSKGGWTTRSASGSKSASWALPLGRENKIYRTPPTPPPEKLQALQQGFITDNVAVASISGDYSRTNPKLSPVIPPFNSQKCRYSRDYFKFHGVDRTLRKTGQVSDGVAFLFLPAANKVWRKVMVLHLSVILFTGVGVIYPGERCASSRGASIRGMLVLLKFQVNSQNLEFKRHRILS